MTITTDIHRKGLWPGDDYGAAVGSITDGTHTMKVNAFWYDYGAVLTVWSCSCGFATDEQSGGGCVDHPASGYTGEFDPIHGELAIRFQLAAKRVPPLWD